MDRRALLFGGSAFACCAATIGAASATFNTIFDFSDSGGGFLISRTNAEWKSMLSRLEYRVMREGGTERAGSSPLSKETRQGIYHCKGCNLAVYSSEAKYDSGTGWPSFYQSLPDAVGTMQDDTWFTRRTEVHCRRCGSHLGHAFNDGPPPTGERHCLNGVSLKFVPASEADMILRQRSRRVLKA